MFICFLMLLISSIKIHRTTTFNLWNFRTLEQYLKCHLIGALLWFIIKLIKTVLLQLLLQVSWSLIPVWMIAFLTNGNPTVKSIMIAKNNCNKHHFSKKIKLCRILLLELQQWQAGGKMEYLQIQVLLNVDKLQNVFWVNRNKPLVITLQILLWFT